MEQLSYNQREIKHLNVEKNLELIREHLQEIDQEIFRLIALRCKTAAEISAAKKQAGAPTIDEIQRDVVLTRSQQWAREEGLDPEQIREVFLILIQMNETAQKQLQKKTD